MPNIVINKKTTSWVRCLAGSYTGVAQSGQPEASHAKSQTSGTSETDSVTTITDNSWVVAFCINGVDFKINSGSITQRRTHTEGGFGDSNGPKTPAGSFSVTFGNYSSWNLDWASLLVVIKPYSGNSIGYDNSSSFSSFGNTITSAYTCSGDNRILLVSVMHFSVDDVDSVTYNGTAMTRIGSPQQQGATGAWLSVYYLIAPTGLNQYTLAVAQASFTETGESAGLFRGFKLVLASNSFVSTGQTVRLLFNHLIGAVRGTFSLLANIVNFRRGGWLPDPENTAEWTADTRNQGTWTPDEKHTVEWGEDEKHQA